MTEHTEQAALIDWANWMVNLGHEPLRWMYHNANGGKRDIEVGAALKIQGVKPGVPDLFLPWPAHGYHGLFIEMKVGSNTVGPKQKAYLAWLNEAGYLAVVANGFDEAKAIIEKYLGI